MSGNNYTDMGLYLHIPFCTKKCPYCHFFVQKDTSQTLHDQLLQGLITEWRLLSVEPPIATVYFGGGTPSLFGAHRVSAFLDEVKKTHNLEGCEITLEVNPEKVTKELMVQYKDAGINRISLGVQSFDDTLLQVIGRTHNAQGALKAVETIHSAGFENITIDLMYELPEQTLETWEKTLKLALTLPITHIALYNLEIEPNTVFYKTKPKQPSQKESLAMYEIAIEKLPLSGFIQYDIAAFAKPGFQAKHNSRYTLSQPFLGLGPSAFSDFQGERRQNVCHLGRYLKSLEEGKLPIDFRETLIYPKNVLERFIVNLRLLEGVLLDKWDLPKETHLKIKQLADLGYLKLADGRVKLTLQGILLFDSIAVDLI